MRCWQRRAALARGRQAPVSADVWSQSSSTNAPPRSGLRCERDTRRRPGSLRPFILSQHAAGPGSWTRWALALRRDRDRFNLDEQLGPAQNCLNASGCGQGIESLRGEESRPLLVESVVIALDVAEVAGGADYVVPGCAFALE